MIEPLAQCQALEEAGSCAEALHCSSGRAILHQTHTGFPPVLHGQSMASTSLQGTDSHFNLPSSEQTLLTAKDTVNRRKVGLFFLREEKSYSEFIYPVSLIPQGQLCSQNSHSHGEQHSPTSSLLGASHCLSGLIHILVSSSVKRY